MKAVSLMSGGLDSTCYTMLKAREGMDVHPLFVDYGQLAREMEWAAVVEVCKKLSLRRPVKVSVTLDRLFLGKGLQLFEGRFTSAFDESVVVPARNVLLVTLASMYAQAVGAGVVLCGFRLEEGDVFPDCAPSFTKAMEEALSAAGVRVKLLSPALEGINTRELILRAAEVDRGALSVTWSCYGSGPEPCGTCSACRSRLERLRWLDER